MQIKFESSTSAEVLPQMCVYIHGGYCGVGRRLVGRWVEVDAFLIALAIFIKNSFLIKPNFILTLIFYLLSPESTESVCFQPFAKKLTKQFLTQ